MKAAAALLLIAAVAAFSLTASDAGFNDRSANAVSVGAASATSYFHLYSRDAVPGADPGCWLHQYAARAGSVPSVPAASGSDRTTAVHLGGRRLQQGTVRCVLAMRAEESFPAGVGQITLHARVGADAATGRRPITGATFRRANGIVNGTTVTLAPEQQVSLELDVDLNPGFSPSGRLYEQVVRVWATWSGNSGEFFSFDVPVKIHDGFGAGPD
jgi:hypothetical protein